MSSMSGGVFLLATIGGYWMLERAAAHKGNLKTVGQVLGWLVIVASLLGVVSACAQCRAGWGAKKMFCPFTPPASSQGDSFTSPAPSR